MEISSKFKIVLIFLTKNSIEFNKDNVTKKE
jgi:hypothetical protein